MFWARRRRQGVVRLARKLKDVRGAASNEGAPRLHLIVSKVVMRGVHPPTATA
jgi:hypothetical protein